MVSRYKGETHDIIKDAWEQDAEIKYLDLKQEKQANRTAEKIIKFILINYHWVTEWQMRWKMHVSRTKQMIN